MKKLVILMVFLLVSSMLYGCSGGSSTKRGTDKPQIQSEEKSANLDVAVYLDGTYSMGGYVNYPAATIYSDGLKGIERTITGGWKQENIQYLKFGDSIQQLSREQFLQSNNVGFYQEVDTSLQKVIDSMDTAKLNIMVTDLFQTNQDIDSLIISLKKLCFADSSKGMALIGVKSQFNGKIYDVGKNSVSFSYTTADDVAAYRPFYLLVLGKEADVRAFTDGYVKLFKDDKLVKAVLFSKHLGTEPVMVAGKAVRNDKKERIANMAQISTLLGSSSDILQYRLKLDEKLSGFNATLTAGKAIGNVPDSFNACSYKVEKWEAKEGKKQSTGFLDKLMGKQAKGTVNAAFTEIKDNGFVEIVSGGTGLRDTAANAELQFKFNPSGIRKAEGKYRLNVAVCPTKEAYLQSNATFDEWSFSDAEASSEEALQAVGGKTLNIDSFVKMVSSLNYEMNKPGFYDIYVYLEAIK